MALSDVKVTYSPLMSIELLLSLPMNMPKSLND